MMDNAVTVFLFLSVGLKCLLVLEDGALKPENI